MRHAGGGPDRRRIGERPADKDATRAERERLDYVGAAAYAAVEHHRQVGHGVHDLRQDAQRRDGAVELPAAVVRNDDPVHTVPTRQQGVFRGQDALDHQRALPAPADGFKVRPGEMRAVGEVAQHAR
ncbi:hypothetical protein D3C72_1441770 [compost metagenome]